MLHEDFFYIADTSMKTRDEWLQVTTELFESSDYNPSEWEATAGFEIKDTGAIEYLAVK